MNAGIETTICMNDAITERTIDIASMTSQGAMNLSLD